MRHMFSDFNLLYVLFRLRSPQHVCPNDLTDSLHHFNKMSIGEVGIGRRSAVPPVSEYHWQALADEESAAGVYNAASHLAACPPSPGSPESRFTQSVRSEALSWPTA